MTGLSQLYDRNGDRKYLNAAERDAFFKALDGSLTPHQNALCCLLLFTGCRISEALNLTEKAIEQDDKTIVFQTLKQRANRTFRAVPIPQELLHSLDKLCASASEGERIWALSRMSAWRLVKKVMARAQIEGIKASPKGLRHGFAIACVTNGVPLPTLQKWLGHTKLETTSIYLDFVGEDERDIARKVWNATSKNRETPEP